MRRDSPSLITLLSLSSLSDVGLFPHAQVGGASQEFEARIIILSSKLGVHDVDGVIFRTQVTFERGVREKNGFISESPI